MTENFDIRFLEIWRRGGTEKVKLECETHAEAVYLRHRLYQIRKKLAKQNHEIYQIAKNGKISIESHPDGTAIVYVLPIDSNFDKILSKAGIVAPEDDLPDL